MEFLISSYDEITEIGFIFPLKITRKLDQIYQITIFTHWTTGSTGKINEFSPTITLTFCLKAHSTPQSRWGTTSIAEWIPWIEETEIREAECARTYRVEFWEETVNQQKNFRILFDENILQKWSIKYQNTQINEKWENISSADLYQKKY